jgi:hypothetical protein
VSKSNNDLIAQALEINPLVFPERPVEMDTMVIKDRPSVISKKDEDFEFVRNNMVILIKLGTKSLTDLADIAEQTQHPRAYEVISTLLNTVMNANKELIGLQKTAQDMEELGSDSHGPSTVNNNLFVGTTSEALAMIKQKKIDGSK